MPKKNFDYEFEDIRREDTPVSAAGFGDMVEDPENPDEAFVEVDLEEDDLAKAVSAASPDAGDDTSANDKDGGSKDARREALDARRRTDQLEVDLETASEVVAGEVTALKKEVAELKAGKEIDAIEEEFATLEGDLTSKMEAAMEEGDTKAQSKLNSELIALNSEKQAKQAAAEASVSIIEDLDGGRTEDQPANKRAVQFIRDNQEWWSDPDHEDAVVYVRKLDKKLVAMGFNPDSEAYWTRFNHNFDKKYEGLREADPDDIDVDLDLGDGKGRRKSPVVAPGGAGGQRRGTKRGDNGQDRDRHQCRPGLPLRPPCQSSRTWMGVGLKISPLTNALCNSFGTTRNGGLIPIMKMQSYTSGSSTRSSLQWGSTRTAKPTGPASTITLTRSTKASARQTRTTSMSISILVMARAAASHP